MKRQGYRKINWVRFLLLLPVCILSCGAPTAYGEYIRLFCGAATLSYFIFSGFLISQNDAPTEQKLLRAIRHTALIALAMLVLNLIVNAIYIGLMGGSIINELTFFFSSKRMLFEFFVMNLWHFPVGENFWFIQSLLYAYIVLYFWYKLGLQKLNWLLFILSMAANIVVGELAGLVHFSVLGYAYVPGNFFTRALPYLLLGILLRDLRRPIARIHIPLFAYLVLIPAGGVLTLVELNKLGKAGLLVYTGHFVGNGIMALGLCLTVILMEYWDSHSARFAYNEFDGLLRWCTTFVYAIHQPFLFVFTILLNFIPVAIAQALASMMAVPVLVGSLALSLLFWAIYRLITKKNSKKPVKETAKQETKA